MLGDRLQPPNHESSSVPCVDAIDEAVDEVDAWRAGWVPCLVDWRQEAVILEAR
jgi:hypothetical protein